MYMNQKYRVSQKKLYSDLNGCHLGQEASRDLIFLHDLDVWRTPNFFFSFLPLLGADSWLIFGENRLYYAVLSKMVKKRDLSIFFK